MGQMIEQIIRVLLGLRLVKRTARYGEISWYLEHKPEQSDKDEDIPF